MPLMPRVSCLVLELRFDSTWFTDPNCGNRREPITDTAPVAGTIVGAGAYTGRLFSFASVNFGTVSRLISVRPVWLTPRAYPASTVNEYRSQKRRLRPRDARQARGASKPGSNTVTLRR